MSRQQYTYDYPRPMVTVDAVVWREHNGGREVLLIQRKNEPFQGMWALPGGFVEIDEPLDDAAVRELEEETGIRGVSLRQMYTFGDPDRDPRGRIITVTYIGQLSDDGQEPRAADDATDVRWFPLADLPALASDHNKVLAHARKHLGADPA
jgi:8-oxo-dGTP diphosphatase